MRAWFWFTCLTSYFKGVGDLDWKALVLYASPRPMFEKYAYEFLRFLTA
jgi:hypothetical protein